MKGRYAYQATTMVAVLAVLASVGGCSVLERNPKMEQEFKAAKSVAVVVPPLKPVTLWYNENRDMEASDTAKVEAAFRKALGDNAAQRISEQIASKLRAEGYEVRIADKMDAADAAVAIDAIAVGLYAESSIFRGKFYRIVMQGRRMIRTSSQEFVDEYVLYFPNMRDDNHGILKQDDLDNQDELLKQFDLTVRGWLDRYLNRITRKNI